MAEAEGGKTLEDLALEFRTTIYDARAKRCVDKALSSAQREAATMADFARHHAGEIAKGLEPLIAELKASRTAWHESYGVPVSEEHARFMFAIGAVTDEVEKLRQRYQGTK